MMCFINLMWAGSVTALPSKASAALITFEANKMKNKNSLKHTYNCMQLRKQLKLHILPDL